MLPHAQAVYSRGQDPIEKDTYDTEQATKNGDRTSEGSSTGATRARTHMAADSREDYDDERGRDQPR